MEACFASIRCYHEWQIQFGRKYASMTSKPQLNLLVIRSPDIHRLAKFYSLLGLEFSLHAHGNGPEHFAAEMDSFVFEIYPSVKDSHLTSATRFGFRVDSLDQLVESLAEAGAVIVSSPKDSPWGRRAVLRDLDGHTVELVE